jgi:hypothetical protein
MSAIIAADVVVYSVAIVAVFNPDMTYTIATIGRDTGIEASVAVYSIAVVAELDTLAPMTVTASS